MNKQKNVDHALEFFVVCILAIFFVWIFVKIMFL